MTGMWYKGNEQAKRLGLWYSGVGMSSCIAYPIAWAMAGPNANTGSLNSWQLLYVVTGAATVFLALVFFFVAPDSQLTVPFLTPAERVFSIEGIFTSTRNREQEIQGTVHQAIEALKDPRSYLYFSCSLSPTLDMVQLGRSDPC
jgi:ACS family allantoate permease-like MFS transporter